MAIFHLTQQVIFVQRKTWSKEHADADHVLDVIRLMKNQNIDKKCILTSDIQLSVNIIRYWRKETCILRELFVKEYKDIWSDKFIYVYN